MVDIIGNIRISNLERVKYLIACIRSYRFLTGQCRFVLNVENLTLKLKDILEKELVEFGPPYPMLTKMNFRHYGLTYKTLMGYRESDYIINFMEDHFMVYDDLDDFKGFIDCLKSSDIQICKSSFHQIEINSIKYLDPNPITSYAYLFDNDQTFHQEYQRYYGKRYYIGVNFIVSRPFACRFWDRDLGPRPHTYEISGYDKSWEHRVAIPTKEIQASIDDDHGEPNTCLLKRTDCKKWNDIWRQVREEYSYLTYQDIL